MCMRFGCNPQIIFVTFLQFDFSYFDNIVKLKHYDDTRKIAYDSQIFRAKEYLKLSHDGPSQNNQL